MGKTAGFCAWCFSPPKSSSLMVRSWGCVDWLSLLTIQARSDVRDRPHVPTILSGYLSDHLDIASIPAQLSNYCECDRSVTEGIMRLDEPFPVESLPPRVRDVVLDEFGGRCPSVREVASLPDAHWLKLPGIGPATLITLRQIAQNLPQETWNRSVSQLSDTELLDLHKRLQKELDDLQCQLCDVRDKIGAQRRSLRAIRLELRLRKLLLRGNGSDNAWTLSW